MKEELKTMLKQALEEYNELKEIIKNHKGSFSDLCKKLNGYDFVANAFFEGNYKSINFYVNYDLTKKEIVLNDDIRIFDYCNMEHITLNFEKDIMISTIKRFLED